MVRFAWETLVSGVIIALILYLLRLNPNMNEIALATALYLVLFPVLVVISLRLFEIPLLLLEIMASAILMSVFHRDPIFAVLSGTTFFVVPFAIQEMKRRTS